MLQRYSFRRAGRAMGMAVLTLSLLGLAACNDDSDTAEVANASDSQSPTHAGMPHQTASKSRARQTRPQF